MNWSNQDHTQLNHSSRFFKWLEAGDSMEVCSILGTDAKSSKPPLPQTHTQLTTDFVFLMMETHTCASQNVVGNFCYLQLNRSHLFAFKNLKTGAVYKNLWRYGAARFRVGMVCWTVCFSVLEVVCGHRLWYFNITQTKAPQHFRAAVGGAVRAKPGWVCYLMLLDRLNQSASESFYFYHPAYTY